MTSSIHNVLTLVMVRKYKNVTQKVCLGNFIAEAKRGNP